MKIIRIRRLGKVCFVPTLYPGDISTGNWRDFPPSTSQLHAFTSAEAARGFIRSLGYADTVDAILDINVDNVQRWAENPNFVEINLDELERLHGLVTTYFVEVEKVIPDDIDNMREELLPLWEKAFREPKFASYNLPNAPIVTDEEVQRRVNHPVLKKYFLALVRHFERVVYLHDGTANRA